LKVVQAMMEAEVEALVGPKGRHDPGRRAVRHGSDDGLVTLGGPQVAIRRPRVRSADGKAEVPLATYDCVTSTEVLGQMAMEKMLAKISTRRYGAGLEPVGAAVEQRSRGTSRSAISRRFVAATETALAELMAKEQAVRLVRQLAAETGKEAGAISRVAHQLGFGAESVRQWVRQADIDEGRSRGDLERGRTNP